MDQFENPFRPGAGTAPPALIGRDQLIAEFKIALRRAQAGRPGQSLMPTGLRGVGKTVLLNRFLQTAQELAMKTGFIEVPESSNFRQLLAVRMRSILLELDRGAASAAVRAALGVLKSFTVATPDGSSVSFGGLDIDAVLGQGDSGILDEDLSDLFVAAATAARDRGSGIFLAIDEVQYLDEVELGALITAVHRCGQLDLPLVIAGAGLPQLPGLAGEAKSYAERLFRFPTVGSLGPDDARAALTVPTKQRGIEIEDDALNELITRTQGYPYFLQVWGHEVWNTAPGSPITLNDVLTVASSVESHLDENFFRVRLDRLTPSEKTYLRAMAELGPGPHRSGDIAARLDVRVESVAPRRSALIRKGMVYSPAHGDTAFTVPLFDEFLMRALPA